MNVDLDHSDSPADRRHTGPIMIRSITVADHAACSALWRATEGIGDVPDRPAFTALIATNPGLGQVAFTDAGNVVGVILATSDGVRGMFYRLAVERSCRRAGVATALLKAATAALAVTGVSRINIHVFAHNTQAQTFWKAHGYTAYDQLDCLHRAVEQPTTRLRPGLPTDLDALMALVAAVIAGMQAQHIDQWDAVYPDRDCIAQDLRIGSATVIEDVGGIIGFVVLNTHQDPPYAPAPWTGTHPAVVHRLMVHPRAQGQGLARRLMAWSEGEALRRGFDSIRLDAFEQNPIAQHLYATSGYAPRGSRVFRKGIFTLFEKALR